MASKSINGKSENFRNYFEIGNDSMGFVINSKVLIYIFEGFVEILIVNMLLNSGGSLLKSVSLENLSFHKCFMSISIGDLKYVEICVFRR